MLKNNLMQAENVELFNKVLELMQNISYNLSTDFSQEIESMSQDQKEALIKNFESVNFEPYRILHFHLYCELVRYEFYDSESCDNKIKSLWNFIVEDNFNLEGFHSWAYSEEKTKWVLTHFLKLLKCRIGLVRSYKMQCIEALNSDNPNANSI